MKQGWFNESRRHRLARLGIKTGRKLIPKKIKLNVLEGNPMFFPQSKEVLKIVELNYTATKLRMGGEEIDPIKLSSVARELEQKFREKGYAVNINTVGGKLTFHDIRLIPEVTGYNISPYTQKRGRVLNWDDWIKVNKIVNQQLDKEKISANVSSLGGKFVIREGTKVKTERDWSTLSLENVGSEVNPVARRDAWRRELGYTAKYKASDIGAVATDVVVGTGAEVKRYAPVIAVAKVRKWVRGKTRKRKAKKKKSRKKGLFYPQAIKEKYPSVVKEITKLSLKHNLKKPILKYGKNKRLATFIPPNTIKLSKRLVFRDRAKRKDVAQHEFKHLIDTQRTNLRDVAKLEKRAIQFEQVTK